MPSSSHRRRVLDTIRSELLQHPTLRLEDDGTAAYVRGSLHVAHEGKTIARYLVEILIPEQYPGKPPIVREVGGAIPADADHHVYSDGTACLFYPAAYWLRGFDRLRFVDFIDGPVRNYFLFQACKKKGVAWTHGEEAHDRQGAVDFFARELGADAATTVRVLEWLAARRATAYSNCPCGSGRDIRQCHTKVLRLQRVVPRWVFQVEARLLRNRG